MAISLPLHYVDYTTPGVDSPKWMYGVPDVYHGRSVAVYGKHVYHCGAGSEPTPLYVYVEPAPVTYTFSIDAGRHYGSPYVLKWLGADPDNPWTLYPNVVTMRPWVLLNSNGQPIYGFGASGDAGHNAEQEVWRVNAISHNGGYAHLFAQPEADRDYTKFRWDWYGAPIMMDNDAMRVVMRNPGVTNVWDEASQTVIFTTPAFHPAVETDIDENMYFLYAGAGGSDVYGLFVWSKPLTLEKRSSGGTLLYSKVLDVSPYTVVPVEIVNSGSVLHAICVECVPIQAGAGPNGEMLYAFRALYLQIDPTNGDVILQDRDVMKPFGVQDIGMYQFAQYMFLLFTNGWTQPCSITLVGSSPVVAFNVNGFNSVQMVMRVGSKWYPIHRTEIMGGDLIAVSDGAEGREGVSLPWQFFPVKRDAHGTVIEHTCEPKKFVPVDTSGFLRNGWNGMNEAIYIDENYLLEGSSQGSNAIWYGE